MEFSTLVGQTITKIDGAEGDCEMIFELADGRRLKMYHNQNCCESVYITSITGDTQDLLNTPILRAEESVHDTPEDTRSVVEKVDDRLMGVDPFADHDSDSAQLWTFYKLATIRGYVDIRWYGSSNGYYSVNVEFEEM